MTEEESLIDLVITTSSVILIMILLSCIACLLMRLSDLKMERWLVSTAKKKGYQLDIEKLRPKYKAQSPLANENCTIMVPDVGYIL